MNSELPTQDEDGTRRQRQLKIVGLRVGGLAAMIAVVFLIAQGMASLPWQIDALIASAVVRAWVYFFERT
jgi:hypothetical protein